jgi:hypothetical protein
VIRALQDELSGNGQKKKDGDGADEEEEEEGSIQNANGKIIRDEFLFKFVTLNTYVSIMKLRISPCLNYSF